MDSEEIDKPLADYLDVPFHLVLLNLTTLGTLFINLMQLIKFQHERHCQIIYITQNFKIATNLD